MNSLDKYAFWQKLRKSHVSVQYRYHRLMIHITGRVVVGFEIVDGQTNLILKEV